MKHVFFLLDCSGSIITDSPIKIGQINDLMRDSIKVLEKHATDIRVICFNDIAKVYWESLSGSVFLDIPRTQFEGRSNLGRAYELLKGIIDKENISLSNCVIALISDGEATDNYKKSLSLLDPNCESRRVALSIGIYNFTTERHALDDSGIFKNGIKDRNEFIDKLIEFI